MSSDDTGHPVLVGDATPVKLVVVFKKEAAEVVGDGAHGDSVGLNSVGLVNSEGVSVTEGPSELDAVVMIKAEDSTEAEMTERIDVEVVNVEVDSRTLGCIVGAG